MYMKGKNNEEKLSENRCENCQWYSKESERKYTRKLGTDKHEVKETRTLCLNSKIKTYKRRITRNSGKLCFELATS